MEEISVKPVNLDVRSNFLISSYYATPESSGFGSFDWLTGSDTLSFSQFDRTQAKDHCAVIIVVADCKEDQLQLCNTSSVYQQFKNGRASEVFCDDEEFEVALNKLAM